MTLAEHDRLWIRFRATIAKFGMSEMLTNALTTAVMMKVRDIVDRERRRAKKQEGKR